METKVPVSEIFYSVQGEGPYTGYPAIFVRFAKCPVRCKWCDSKFSWKDGLRYSFAELVEKVNSFGVREIPVILTGGEPSIVDEIFLSDFIKQLKFLKYFVHVETAGIKWVNCFSDCDLVVVSPKMVWYEKKSKEYLYVLTQYKVFSKNICWKFVIKDETDVVFMRSLVGELEIVDNQVWLMPEGRTREEVIKNIKRVIEIAKKYSYKVSDRLHIIAYNKKKGV